MKQRVAFAILMLVVTAGAVALRVPRLALRPMHCDEAVHADKFGDLYDRGHYRYDPYEFHGPTLNYLTLLPAWLGGAERYADIDETTLRIVPVAFGLLTVLLLLLLGDGLGYPAAICAAVLTAVSTAMVFYSRYYIQETLLVCFTLATIVGGWRYVRSGSVGWCVLAGAGLGLMHATKETWIIPAAAMVAALVCTGVWQRLRGARLDLGRRVWNWRLAAGLVAGVVVSVVLFTSFFTNASGPLDSIRTYVYCFCRAGGGEGTPHVHPWHFYLEMLTFARYGRGPAWSEGLIVVLAVAGAVAGITGRGLGKASAPLVRFLTFYTVFTTVIYSVIPYKTPWCLLGFLHGMVLLGGVGAVAIVRWVPSLPAKIVAGVLLAGAAGQLAWQAHRASYRLYDSRYNPYVYAHSLRGVVRLGRRAEQLAAVHPDGHDMLIRMVAPDKHDFWPVPWYLRRFGRVGYHRHLPPGGERGVAMLIFTAGAWEQFPPALQGRLLDANEYQLEHYGLRPAVVLAVSIRRELWRKFMAPMRARQRGVEANTMPARSQPSSTGPPPGRTHRFRRRAMASIFEVRLAGMDADRAAGAAETAFEEMKRIEKELNRFNAYSDVGRINGGPAGVPVRIGMDALDCLVAARTIWTQTDGAFDVTARPPDGRPPRGEPGGIGMKLLKIDEGALAVARLDECVQVDLGGIGKGYALDRMAAVLREEWDVEAALLHGGMSTVLALGCRPGRPGWRLALRDPSNAKAPPLGWVTLTDRALSGSSTVHKRHIIDPRTGEAVPAGRAAWAVADSAAAADALSTAFCVMENHAVERYAQDHREVTAILAVREAGRWRLVEFGRPVVERNPLP